MASAGVLRGGRGLAARKRPFLGAVPPQPPHTGWHRGTFEGLGHKWAATIIEARIWWLMAMASAGHLSQTYSVEGDNAELRHYI